MGAYQATIRTLADGETTTDLVVDHHLVDRAAIRVEVLSGAHLLHLAVAGCLFDDILREAPRRGIVISHLAVTASGDFDEHGSRGVGYAVEIRSVNDRTAVERLVEDMERAATIPRTLRAGLAVEGVGTSVTTG